MHLRQRLAPARPGSREVAIPSWNRDLATVPPVRRGQATNIKFKFVELEDAAALLPCIAKLSFLRRITDPKSIITNPKSSGECGFST